MDEINLIQNNNQVQELSSWTMTIVLLQAVLFFVPLYFIPMFLCGMGSSAATCYLADYISKFSISVILALPILSFVLFFRSSKGYSTKKYPFIAFISSFIFPIVIMVYISETFLLS